MRLIALIALAFSLGLAGASNRCGHGAAADAPTQAPTQAMADHAHHAMHDADHARPKSSDTHVCDSEICGTAFCADCAVMAAIAVDPMGDTFRTRLRPAHANTALQSAMARIPGLDPPPPRTA